MAKLEALVFGDLRIEPAQASPGEAVDLHFRGRSTDRHPARTVVPYIVDILASAALEGVPLRLHFEAIEHMNSSTITALIQIIQESRNASVPLVVHFDPKKAWQKLSFEALSVFVKDDGLLRLVGAP